MKTCSVPSRGSTHTAVRMVSGAETPGPGGTPLSAPRAPVPAPGPVLPGPRRADGSRAASASAAITRGWVVMRAQRLGSGGRAANGSTSTRYGNSSLVTQANESSGRRHPIAESPGIKYMRSGRRNQRPLRQRAAPGGASTSAGAIGSA